MGVHSTGSRDLWTLEEGGPKRFLTSSVLIVLPSIATHAGGVAKSIHHCLGCVIWKYLLLVNKEQNKLQRSKSWNSKRHSYSQRAIKGVEKGGGGGGE